MVYWVLSLLLSWGSELCRLAFYLFTNNCRPWCDVNQHFEGDEAGSMLGKRPDLPVPYFLLSPSKRSSYPGRKGLQSQEGWEKR